VSAVALPVFNTPRAGEASSSRAPRSVACDSADSYRSDIDSAIGAIEGRYVYLADKRVDWARAESVARSEASVTKTKRDYVGVLERLLDNLYDPHATLKANTAHSPRLVPSGLDLWAEWRGTNAIVTAVRPWFSAAQAGIRPGMVVTTVNGVTIGRAAETRLGPAVKRPAPADALAWALPPRLPVDMIRREFCAFATRRVARRTFHSTCRSIGASTMQAENRRSNLEKFWLPAPRKTTASSSDTFG